VKICSRDYKLTFDRDLDGGCFYSYGKTSEGDAEIIVGHYKDLRYCAEILLHEITEAILCEDDKRFSCTAFDDDNSRYLFMFPHDYLDTIGPKLLDALLTSGFFSLIDGRPHMPKCKKSKKKGK
jgi:hypothetical protein